MTKQMNMPFYVWPQLNATHKINNGFPVHDMGVDVTDINFSTIIQCKYYAKNNMITYARLSTFLSTPLLVHKKMNMVLIRTDHSLLDPYVSRMVKRGDISDITLCTKTFQAYIRQT
jgi:hypothetical protein